MPEYLYRNPETGQIKSVIQRMTEPHIYEEDGVKWDRVFIAPGSSVDTHIDPLSSKDFSEKMGKKSCKLGDMFDESKALSEKRSQMMGKDPVREQYLADYRKRRKGRPHPSEVFSGFNLET